ncbi:hypothetical protein DRQ09_06185 [candidate division KSB1 bacterium]|nr:MAG: hypothetical protein DRQ09_06185 [candidate division KSB1 bacterium]
MNEKDKAIEDLKIIRNIIDRTKEAIDPGASILILWGILVFIGNIITHFILINKISSNYIGYTWWSIAITGFIISMFMGYKIGLRRYKYGFNHYISRQLALVWTIIIPTGIVWTIIGPHFNIFTYESASVSVLWSMLYSIGIYTMGIFYSKEFLFGGIAIFLGTILSVIFIEIHCIIIGIFTGGGTTIPAIIAHRRFNKNLRKNK